MSTLAYRLRIYQERAQQSNLTTEPDILVGSGAVHSDNFQVATMSGVSGYTDYLDLPEGRTSKLDRLTRKTDQGQMTFTLTDKRTTAGGSNLSRWVTGFLSVLKPGCKVVCEESDDGGSTWDTWWTGRVDKLRLATRNAIAIQCKDMLADLARQEVFGGRPEASITYAAEPLLLPLGLSAAFGSQPAVPLLSGTISSDGVFRTITLDGKSKGRKENVVTAALIRAARIPLGKVNVPLEVRASKHLRVRFTAGAVTQKEAEIVKLEVQRRAKHFQVNKVWLKAVDTDDVYYTSLTTGTIADATAVTSLAIRQLATAEGGGETPLLIDGVRAPQLIADLLDGKFGPLNDDGTVSRTFPYNASNFSTFTADDTFPLLRFVIPKPANLKAWVEEHLLRQCGLAWRLNASGEVVLIDMRPLTASPTSTTITEADLADGSVPEWEEHRDQAINVVRATTFIDVDRDADTLGDNYVPAVPTTLLDSYEVAEPLVIVGDNYDLGTLPYDLRCEGFRTFPNETLDNQERAQVLTSQVLALAAGYRTYGAGLIYVTMYAARTSNTDCQVGDWRVIDIDVLPDPGTNLRGGPRLMQCVERTDQAANGIGRRRLRFEDGGLNAVATAPTVGTPAQETSNTQHGITVAVTLNASSEIAKLYVNTTATSVGTRPADTDTGWRLVKPVEYLDQYIRATGTVTVRPVAAGKRHWVAVETAPVIGSKLQSVRAYPSGTGYVDSAALTAPNTAAIGSVSTKAALLTWSNNGDDVSAVEIWLASGTSEVNAEAATPVVYRRLAPGSTGFQFTALDTTLPDLGTAGPWYYPQVKHADGYGGYSTAAEIAGASFQATGAAGTAPTMAAVLVTRDNSNSPYPGAGSGGAVPAGGTGVELKLVAAPTGLGLDIELERAPDSGGSPGTYAQIAKIPSIGSVAQVYRDPLPRNGLTYWYRARLSGDGVSAGSYATAVSASPGWLPLVAFGVGLPEEATLGETKTYRIHAADFQPTTETSDYFLDETGMQGAAVGTGGTTFTAAVKLPVGVTMTAIRVRGGLGNASDAVSASLQKADGSGSSSIVGSAVSISGTGFSTASHTFATPETIGAESYAVKATINAVVTSAKMVWVEVDYTMNAYIQGL